MSELAQMSAEMGELRGAVTTLAKQMSKFAEDFHELIRLQEQSRNLAQSITALTEAVNTQGVNTQNSLTRIHARIDELSPKVVHHEHEITRIETALKECRALADEAHLKLAGMQPAARATAQSVQRIRGNIWDITKLFIALVLGYAASRITGTAEHANPAVEQAIESEKHK
jgi:uncharacterized coiled-coil DUF342 family protein